MRREKKVFMDRRKNRNEGGLNVSYKGHQKFCDILHTRNMCLVLHLRDVDKSPDNVNNITK